MAINLKLKANLKEQIEKENTSGKDTRFLNYWDLKEGEKMSVLFLPDASGEKLWEKFSKHGPNLNVSGVEHINCARTSNADTCPACQKAFDLNNLANETGDESYKKEAKRWFPKHYTLVQCIVLESPMDIAESPDGNQVKLMYLPYGIEKVIKEAVVEEQVQEEDIPSTPFIIKKSKNQGGWASYDNSYFARKEVTDDELAFFDDMKVEQFDFSEIDVIPAPTTEAEVQEWLDKVEAKVEASDAKESSKNDFGSKSSSTKEKLADKLNARKETNEDDDKEQVNVSKEEADEKVKEETSSSSSRGASLRDRLRARSQA